MNFELNVTPDFEGLVVGCNDAGFIMQRSTGRLR